MSQEVFNRLMCYYRSRIVAAQAAGDWRLGNQLAQCRTRMEIRHPDLAREFHAERELARQVARCRQARRAAPTG